MDGNKQPGRRPIAWTQLDDMRLRALMLAMFPISKILAEFSDHDANVVRDAFDRLFVDGATPLELALAVLGDRARKCSRSRTGLVLDHRPAGTAQVVDAANAVLRDRGLRGIPFVGGIRA